MGWQDAPEVSAPAAWQSAPVIDDAKTQAKSTNIGDIIPEIGAAQGAASLLSGAVAAPVAGLTGMAAAFAKVLGITDTEAGDVVRKVQEAMTYEPPSKMGKAIVNTVSYPFEKLAEGANAAGEKVTDVTGSPALGAAANTGIQAIPMLVGAKGARGSSAVGDVTRNVARDQMQSALKPTLEQLRTGKGEAAVNTMLDEGLNVTPGGVEKLRDRVDALNERVKDIIDNSPATIDKQRVGYYVQSAIDRFQKQVNPTSDLAAIQRAWDEFLAVNPAKIPIREAQEMKQGTYRALREKSYGELKGADIEAQKALARGLKEEIAAAAPEVRKLNADESKYLNALSVVERRVLMDANKNPAGLGWLTTSPEKFALWMADRSPLFKSLIARMINAAADPLEAGALTASAATTAGGPATAAERERRDKRRRELMQMLDEQQ